MAHTFTFDAVYAEEDIEPVPGETEVRFTYNYFPAQRAYTPPGEYAPMDPPEPARVELVNIQIERSVDGKMVWCDADGDEWRRFSAWAMHDLFEAMLENGADEVADRYASASERD